MTRKSDEINPAPSSPNIVTHRIIQVIALGVFLVAGSRALAADFDQTHARYAEVLTRHVKNALVDYAGLKADPSGLDAYLDEIAAVPPEDFKKWPKEQQLALLLNLYNAQTLKLIVDHHPITSIRKIGFLPGAAWRIENVRFGGAVMSLDHLEHEVIRAGYDEPRIHFAVVCAALSCPPLRSEPYVGAKLNEQLNDQAKQFLGNMTKNRFDAGSNTLWLSPIFEWYEADFTKPAGTLQSYVQPFLPESSRNALKRATDVTVKFNDYDWSLNEWKK